MQEISLFIDESGNLGKGSGRYFLICALEISADIQKTMSRRSGRIINRFKEKYKKLFASWTFWCRGTTRLGKM